MVKKKSDDNLYKCSVVKLYLTKEQEEILIKHQNACRYTYNICLRYTLWKYAECISKYEDDEMKVGFCLLNTKFKRQLPKMSLSFFDTVKWFTEWKKLPENNWILETSANCLNNNIEVLNNSFKRLKTKNLYKTGYSRLFYYLKENYCEGKEYKNLRKYTNKAVGFPSYKKRHFNISTQYTGKGKITLFNNNVNKTKLRKTPDPNLGFTKLNVPGIGKPFIKMRGFNMDLYSLPNFELNQVTIYKDPSNNWKASLRIRYTNQKQNKINKTKICGIDMGIADFITDSTGVKFTNKHFIKTNSKNLRTKQKKLSLKTNLKNKLLNKDNPDFKRTNINKARIQVAKIQEKTANQRKAYHWEIITELVNKYDIIVCETLSVKNMMKNNKLSKAISDMGWSEFLTKLELKLKEKGGILIRIDRWFASSKLCSHCGHKKEKLNLSIRTWTCEQCNTTHDRDINAAINIKNEGIKILNNMP